MAQSTIMHTGLVFLATAVVVAVVIGLFAIFGLPTPLLMFLPSGGAATSSHPPPNSASSPVSSVFVPPTIPGWPFDATQAAEIQRKQAEDLNIPVTFTDEFGIEFVLIPAGKFVAGSPKTEPRRGGFEGQRIVDIPNPFYLSRGEISISQYESIMKIDSSRSSADQDIAVSGITWEMATHFLEQLNRQSHRKYRFAMANEWEWACRAGTSTPFSFGKMINTTEANFNPTCDEPYYVKPGQSKPAKGPREIDYYPGNAWGVRSMHGNLKEWVADDAHTFKSTVPDGDIAYIPKPGVYRIAKGGSWDSCAHSGRAARFTSYSLNMHSAPHHGLRLVLVIGAEKGISMLCRKPF